MPNYRYECDCGFKKTVDKPMAQYDTKETCDKCGSEMYRDFGAEHSTRKAGDLWPHASYAAGVSPSEVPAMMKIDRENGVPTEYTPEGDPIWTSKSHRRKYCEVHRLYDRNAGYSDPAPKYR